MKIAWRRGLFRIWLVGAGLWISLIVMLVVLEGAPKPGGILLLAVMPPAIVLLIGACLSWAMAGFAPRSSTEGHAITTVANAPILLLAQRRPPFSEWREPDAAIPDALEPTIMSFVWWYQIYVYNLLAHRRFGADTAAVLRAEQIRRLNMLPERLGDSMQTTFALFDRAADIEPPTVEGEPVPMEYGFAVALLCGSPESPYASVVAQRPKGTPLPKFDGLDDALALCLLHGKSSALQAFAPIIEHVSVR